MRAGPQQNAVGCAAAGSFVGVRLRHEHPCRGTSRSEYRLLLRQDNADQRLTRRGYDIGLVPEARLRAVEAKYDAVAREIARLTHTGVSPSPALAAFLAEKGTADAPDGCPLVALLRRPQ